MPQLLEKLADVGANLGGVRVGELDLQFCDDLAECAFPIALLENLPACSLELDRALGKQNHPHVIRARLVLDTPAATGGQTRLGRVFRRRHAGWPRCGTRRAAAILAARRRSRGRRAEPIECRTYRAEPGAPTPAQRAFSRCRRRSSPRTANPRAPDRV